MKNNKFTGMSNKNIILSLPILVLVFVVPIEGQSQDKLPVREYTNPEEVVTFDRTTPFVRALDVINDFSQEEKGRVILDRTGQGGDIGITVPPMHWEDALDLILRVNGLVLLEREKFFEIVEPQIEGEGIRQASSQPGGEEGPIATTKSREVRINAIFFEGNKRALQEIGVDWSTLSENVPEDVSNFVGSEGGSGGDGQLPSTNFGDQFVSVNSKGAQSVSQNVFNSLINFGEIGTSGIRVQALFSAFEADNLGEILASPTVKVLDGQEGRIQVGQDFSIKQRDFAGNVTDNFFSVGTILQVTPQIIEQEDTTFIHLTIEAQRSSAQPDPVSTVINKQEAITQSLLIDGEATVIAGLYRAESAEVRRGVPILKDLPPWLFGLRYLFGYNSKDYQMRELVILIQASIEPSLPERFAQTEYKDKYEILQEERRRIRDELRKSTLDTGDLIGEPENTDSSSKQKTVEEFEPVANNQPEKPEKKKVAAKSSDRKEEERKQADKMKENDEASAITGDPEVKPRPVSLNFGSNDEPESNSSSQKTSQGAMQAEEKSTSSAKAEVEVKKSQSSGYTYYIIGAAFQSEQNAIDYKDELTGKDFPAIILTKANSDFFYVAYNQYGQLDQARVALQGIRENQNDGAWIYRSK